MDANHTLAEASKLVPKGVICLNSALAYHGLTDQIPARAWLATGRKDWRLRLTGRMTETLETSGMRSHNADEPCLRTGSVSIVRVEG